MITTMDLRAATDADFPAIFTLFPADKDELFLIYPRATYPFTIEQLQALAQQRRDLSVLADRDRVLGFANLYDITPQGIFIGNVVIDKDHRCQGLGRQLVAYMLDLIFNKYDCPCARIAVFCHNTPALRLYVQFGFKPYDIEERTDNSSRRMLLIHMQLPRTHYQQQTRGA